MPEDFGPPELDDFEEMNRNEVEDYRNELKEEGDAEGDYEDEDDEPRCPRCGGYLIEGDNGLECQECSWYEENEVGTGDEDDEDN